MARKELAICCFLPRRKWRSWNWDFELRAGSNMNSLLCFLSAQAYFCISDVLLYFKLKKGLLGRSLQFIVFVREENGDLGTEILNVQWILRAESHMNSLLCFSWSTCESNQFMCTLFDQLLLSLTSTIIKFQLLLIIEYLWMEAWQVW